MSAFRWMARRLQRSGHPGEGPPGRAWPEAQRAGAGCSRLESVRNYLHFRKLAEEPEQQGRPLVNVLAGLRSVRAVGQLYRIIYVVQGEHVKVIVVAVGIRKEGTKDPLGDTLRTCPLEPR